MDLIDLHTHSTVSDGSLTPGELVDHGLEVGLRALALTDHDTVDGLDEALARGALQGLEVVPGIEISAEFPPGTMHMLGYFLDHAHSEFAHRLGQLQDARKQRNPQMIEKLRQNGFDITMDEVESMAGEGGQVGRPHFARVMVEKGWVDDTKEAFNRYLAKGAPAYVDKFRFSPREAIALIRMAGGVPVLAHPFTLNASEPDVLRKIVAELKGYGLAGLEAYYSEHTPEMTRQYLELAASVGLMVTGGSDYHGSNKKGVELGRGMGNLAVPYRILQEIKDGRKELI